MQRHVSTQRLLLALVFCSQFLAPSAQAGLLGLVTGAAAGAVVRGAGSKADLSRDELRKCVQLEKSLKLSSSALDNEQKSNADVVKAIRLNETSIKEAKTKVNKGSKKSVDAYKAMVAENQERIGAYNKSLVAFNAKVTAHQASHSNYKSTCVGKSFKENDMKAIQAE